MVGSKRDLTLRPIACAVCGKTDGILVCPACRIAHYCGEDHRKSDEERHNGNCMKFKQAYDLAQKQAQLRPSGQVFIDLEPGQDPPGSDEIWRLFTRTMDLRNRFNAANLVLGAFGGPGGYQSAVQRALEGMVSLGSQVRGTELRIPLLYLRLGRDQEAYNFVKSFVTPKSDGDRKDEDSFESLEGLWSDPEKLDLCHTVSVALIKARLLLDLRAIQKTKRAFRGTLLEEIITLICHQQVGNIIRAHRDIVWADVEKVSALIQTTKGQLKDLYSAIAQNNKYFWGHLLFGGDSIMKMRMTDVRYRGSPDVAWYVVKQSYAAWAETPGALDLIDEIYVHEQAALMGAK